MVSAATRACRSLPTACLGVCCVKVQTNRARPRRKFMMRELAGRSALRPGCHKCWPPHGRRHTLLRLSLLHWDRALCTWRVGVSPAAHPAVRDGQCEAAVESRPSGSQCGAVGWPYGQPSPPTAAESRPSGSFARWHALGGGLTASPRRPAAEDSRPRGSPGRAGGLLVS